MDWKSAATRLREASQGALLISGHADRDKQPSSETGPERLERSSKANSKERQHIFTRIERRVGDQLDIGRDG